MTPNEKTIAAFETRIRQMILRFQELEKENQELYSMIEKNEQDIKQLQAKLEQGQNDYNSLKMAKMIEITDGDLDGAKTAIGTVSNMVDQSKLNIRLHVYDEEIEVKINREDEEFYRNAAKLITDRYNAYAQAYKGRKTEHIISLMTLVDIALLYEKERSHNDTAPYDNVLARLTKEIEEALGTSR